MASITDVQRSEQAYYDTLDRLHVAAFWRLEELRELTSPFTPRPYVWRWRDLCPELQRAAEIVDLESGADRRVLTVRNPGLHPWIGATHTITASLQMILPGEIAPAHRHTMAALRFIIAGDGGYTVVDGEKLPMSPGDLILTPSWTWHDHGNEGAGPMVWLDGLDVPFTRSLRALFYQDYPGRRPQPQDKPPAGSYYRYGTGTLLPAGERPTTLHSPLNLYTWEQAYEGLRRAQALEVDAYDGTVLEYVNPLTGGHALPTIGCYLQALRPGAHTKAHRHTASAVYFVVRGRGYSIIEGARYDWEQHDILAVPPWVWHEHVASDGDEVVLFAMNDLPVLEPFGLYREEPYRPNGGFQPVGS